MIGEIVPVLGVLVGLIVPLACFFWAYHEDKGKREAVIEIAKHLDDPAKIESYSPFSTNEKVRRLTIGGAVSLPCLLASVFTSLGKRH